MASPIENAEDLAKQTAIQYGCKFGGSTYNFFEVKMKIVRKSWKCLLYREIFM